MDAVYVKIRKIARNIVARYPRPDFYVNHPTEIRDSKRFYRSNTTIRRLREDMDECLDNDFGHGMSHVEKVAIDAGILVIIESRLVGLTEKQMQRNLLLVQCAGLLHDICRKEKSHAEKGAETAVGILRTYPLLPDEVSSICAAIRNHEAFVQTEQMPAYQPRMISDCLYDADKFRWGPDNFAHTIWDMVGYLKPSFDAFMEHYPKGMVLLKKIRCTFRSETGKRFGPQFIDMGISIGEELYQVIQSEIVNPQ